MISTRLKSAIGKLCARLGACLAISRQGAAQIALFAMLLQAMIPLSAAVPLPADDGIRDGQSIPSFYLVICTAYGAQTRADVSGEPLDKAPSNITPWDCPVCQTQTSVQGPTPVAPQVAFTPLPLPRGCDVPEASDKRVALWSAAPGRARAPPAA